MATHNVPFTPPLPLPFPVDANGKTTLHPPLSRVDRGSIAAWIVSTTAFESALGNNQVAPITLADLNKESDQGILDLYGVIVLSSRGTENLPSPNPFKSVGEFLGKLSEGQLWVRIAEFSVGALLIAIGANAALKAATTQSRNPITSGTRQVVKPIATAGRATGRATFLAGRKYEANKYVRS